MKKNCIKLVMSVLICIFSVTYLAAHAEKSVKGEIRGRIISVRNRGPVSGVLVSLLSTELKTVSDESGQFIFKEVPVGSYVLKVESGEIMSMIIPDVIVKSEKITFVEETVTLKSMLDVNIEVRPDYFKNPVNESSPSAGISSEEIRRAPGAGGDISRVISSLPGVSQTSDMMNTLVVRGGSPSENSFFIDNIEIPNINHFPQQGASGGPVALINSDFIKEVDFYSGGFSAIYGGVMSSVMDISFREGNTQKCTFQADLSFMGAGFAAEGPFADKGSWLFSVRRSYIDLITDMMGSSIAPNYSDLQGKAVFNLSDRTRLIFLAVGGIDDNEFDREQCLEDGNNYYGETHTKEAVTGINMFNAWADNFYSDTSVSWHITKYSDEYFDTYSENRDFENNSEVQALNFRNVSHLTLSHNFRLDFGAEYKIKKADYRYDLAGFTDSSGNQKAKTEIRRKYTSHMSAFFVNLRTSVFDFFRLNLGGRIEKFGKNSNYKFSPRLSAGIKTGKNTDIYFAYGKYVQDLPLHIISQREEFEKLKKPHAIHYVTGFSWLINENTQLRAEAYIKNYRNCPEDLSDPDKFIFDSDPLDYFENFSYKSSLSDTGSARSKGVEITLQKKLKEKLYGAVSVAFTNTEYRDSSGRWIKRAYDNRVQVNMEAGYRLNRKWEFSLKWTYSGGRPYTPYDSEMSARYRRGILDNSGINSERMPAYHSLNIRADRRFYFRKSNLTVYLSIWNAYNRKNHGSYYWNIVENKVSTSDQFGLLPVFGAEFEF